jgi:sec-independent protein translocase protein TatA
MVPLAVLGLGPGELILLLLVIIVIFGAGKIPQIGTSLGKGIKNFRKAVKGEDEEEDEEDKNAPKPS